MLVSTTSLTVVRVVMVVALATSPAWRSAIDSAGRCCPVAVQMRFQRVVRAVRVAGVDAVRVAIVRGIPFGIGQERRLW